MWGNFSLQMVKVLVCYAILVISRPRRLATWRETELLIQQNVFLCDVTTACSTLTGRTATGLISRNMFHAFIQLHGNGESNFKPKA